VLKFLRRFAEADAIFEAVRRQAEQEQVLSPLYQE